MLETASTHVDHSIFTESLNTNIDIPTATMDRYSSARSSQLEKTSMRSTTFNKGYKNQQPISSPRTNLYFGSLTVNISANFSSIKVISKTNRLLKSYSKALGFFSQGSEFLISSAAAKDISQTLMQVYLHNKTLGFFTQKKTFSAIVKDTSQSQWQTDSPRKTYSLSKTEEYFKDSVILKKVPKKWQPANQSSSKAISSSYTGGFFTPTIDRNFKKETVKRICSSSKPKEFNGTERGINTSLILLTSVPLLILIICVIFLFLVIRQLQHKR